jgi:hypothetical protein
MSRQSVREEKHEMRVMRVLSKAVHAMQKLTAHARVVDTFPNTTKEACIELMNVEARTRIRFAMKDSEAV